MNYISIDIDSQGIEYLMYREGEIWRWESYYILYDLHWKYERVLSTDFDTYDLAIGANDEVWKISKTD